VRPVRPLLLAGVVAMVIAGPAGGQFLETFDEPGLRLDPSGVDGWAFFTGDGEATIELVATGEGYASIVVDATRDRRNVWWALIKHRVSQGIDVARLSESGWELRVAARVRTSHAPRRVNLHVNTQRTTDFHSHLMEFDLPVAGVWHEISMTTRDFPVIPGDTVFAQMAMMDWGRDVYRVDVDYLKVDVVESARAGPDVGDAVPYHPPVQDPASFAGAAVAAEAAVIDLANPAVNLSEWSALESGARQRLLTVNGSMLIVLRFDLAGLRGRRVAGAGLLELTTVAIQRDAREMKDMGLLRVAEILSGDPAWRRETVTLDGLLRGGALAEVVNPQPIIDWPVNDSPGGKTRLVISRPVLQRLVDGRSPGLAVAALGPIDASFQCCGADAPRLLFNVVP
jgi:hypothetical protein